MSENQQPLDEEQAVSDVQEQETPPASRRYPARYAG